MTEKSSTQQLTLLPAPEVPVQFRLDEATRRRGLRHLAEIRLQMAARQAERGGDRSDVSRPNAA